MLAFVDLVSEGEESLRQFIILITIENFLVKFVKILSVTSTI